MISRTAIILSAGRALTSPDGYYGRGSAGMLAVGGRPVIHWSLAMLRRFGVERAIIGHRADDQVMRHFVSQAFSRVMDIKLIPIRSDRGPGGTLLDCLRELEEPEPVLVVLGDTLFQLPEDFSDDVANFVLIGADPGGPSRWCYALSDGRGVVDRLVDKPAERPEGGCPLIGVYGVHDPAPGRQALEALPEDRVLQLSDFLAPYVQAHDLHTVEAGDWLDCGHLDSLAGSRRRLLATRVFNDIAVDEMRGMVTKRSRNVVKLIDEINFYRLVPPDLQSFFPRVLDYSIKREDVYLTMEYYGYPTLSELWVFSSFDPLFWRRVFRRLCRTVGLFSEIEIPAAADEVDLFYWGKTVSRIEAFAHQSPAFEALTEAETLEINGKRLLGWPKLKEAVHEATRKLADNCRFQLMHGDLCFPNILYDPISEAMKCIDVRGRFVGSGLYGDGRYDIAKILHSIHGGYDFIIQEMYRLTHEGERLEFEIFWPERRDEVLRCFQEEFADYDIDREIRLIEGLLFVSMCPLHADYPQRQVTMFGRGIEILNQWTNHEDMY